MGVITKEEYQNMDKGPLKIEETVCFFCGSDLFDDEKATGGVVFWDGIGKQIALHQACAELLGLHLIQDARSCVRIVGVRSQMTHRPPKPAGPIWFTKK